VAIELVFETHSTTEDNLSLLASGWLPGKLSDIGREQALQLGRRRQHDGIDVVFSSDLQRALETAEIAFGGTAIPLLHDWRLRECDYGLLNGRPTSEVVAERAAYLEHPYPGGESWHQAVRRVGSFLADLPLRWEGARVLVLGHVATRWGLDHWVNGKGLADLAASEFAWQEGWEYVLPTATGGWNGGTGR
jgi:2,3-bisphosphoglycerate-dependent phosphoglycerate mutase